MKIVRLGGLNCLGELSVSDVMRVRRELTFRRWDYRTGETEPVPCFAEKIVNGKPVLYVPRYYSCGQGEVVDLRSEGRYLPEDLGLKEGVELSWAGIDQDAFVTKAIAEAQIRGGGYCIAPCGCGKTIMGCEIVRRLGRTALVILSRRFQVQHWTEEWKRVMTRGDILGRFQADARTENLVTIGTINTLLKIPDPAFFMRFGTVIFDEGHHLPARTWISMLARLRSKYIFALTASFYRTDRLDAMFRVLLGETIAEAKAPRVEGGEVTQVLLEPAYDVKPPWSPGRKSWAKRLGESARRNALILDIVKELYRQGKDLLVFSDIVAHLRRLSESFSKRFPEEVWGLYLGGMAQAALAKSGAKRVTFITYDMGIESLNLPKKDTIVCATPPPGNLKQLKGRIDRVIPGKKKTPLVIDLVDFILREKGEKRARKWRIEGMSVQIKRGEEYGREPVQSRLLQQK